MINQGHQLENEYGIPFLSLDIGIRKSKENLHKSREPPRVHINFILLEFRVIGLHVRRDSMHLSSFKFSWWAPKDARVLKQSA